MQNGIFEINQLKLVTIDRYYINNLHSTWNSEIQWIAICSLINEGENNQLGAIIAKAVKQGFLAPDQPTFQEICDSADVSLFHSMLQNSDHVLHELLPPGKIQNYSLRERVHNREIPCTKSVTFSKTFIMSMLYLESYWI